MDGTPTSVNTHVSQTSIKDDIFAGGGDMGALMRTLDWSQTPLGPVEQWPQSLRTAVSICLASRFPMLIWWGPELVMLYNDAYRPILGATKHPRSMGQRGRECWPEIWDIIGPMLEGVLTRGEATWSNDQMLPLDRNGYVEECYFTFSYSPIRDESGGIGGVFTAVTETTGQVLSERRLNILHELADRSAEAQTAEEVCFIAAETLSANVADIPFALLYLLQQQGTQAVRAGMYGLKADSSVSPTLITLPQSSEDPGLWSMERVIRTGEPEVIQELPEDMGFIGITPPKRALVLPMARPGQSTPYGLLITGISPYHALDNDYQNFFELVAEQIANTIGKARAIQEANERAELLAELDRAKTNFFSNVSHEFRTPLTLLLGPVEDLLVDTDQTLSSRQHEQLDIVRRNALRLLKLVNTLLDFSRIEASRLQAIYEPTDLATFTAELASVFRSAVEKAGMQLVIDCPPLSEPVYVDRDMWEKIVLNLLSNAFKFTFSGQITVSLRHAGNTVTLSVSDTGTGIPEEELPHLFERFHRVQEARARTHEGSGIGLALVNELVQFHGGSVRVDSIINEGTTFTISLPLGSAHLPLDRVRETFQVGNLPIIQHASPYIEEATRWLPEQQDSTDRTQPVSQPEAFTTPVSTDSNTGAVLTPAGAAMAHILLADDNADMRDYVKRLLSNSWSVEAVGDGNAALAAIQRHKPDLVLSDIMMPGLDGFQLLRALRDNADTSDIPVILLSARAGEEAAIEGIEAGADDYLIKPFTARELLARVSTHIRMTQLQQQAARRERAHASYLQKLAQASIVITSTPSLEERSLLIADQARVIIGAHQGVACFVGNGQTTLPINAVSLSEKYAQWRDYDALPDGSGIYSLVSALGKPMRMTQQELEQHPAWHHFGAEANEHPPLRGWLAVPLIGRNGRKLGLLQLSDKYEGEFSAEDEVILAQFAHLAAIAIENAELYSEAQNAVRGRDELISVVTHDLKNPVGTIKGYAQLLKRQLSRAGELNKEQLADGLSKIDATATRMVTLINEMLNFTRLQMGQSIELDRQPTHLIALVQRTVAEYQQTTEQHIIRVQAPARNIVGVWDATQLVRVLGNLLSNAIKYSPDGGEITVEITVEQGKQEEQGEQGEQPGIAVIAVRDHGIGIPAADLPRVFEQFHRAGNVSGKFTGTGIGLASARLIVEQHGGTLTVDSDEGSGSMFTIRLPLQ